MHQNNPAFNPSTDSADPPGESSVLEDMHLLWLELRGLSHDRFRLAALETQRAGRNLVDMLIASVMIAVLLNGAWLGLVAATVLGLVENGIAASSAILLAVAVNLLLVLVFCVVIRHKSHYLKFPAFLRSLQPIPPDKGVGKSS